MTENWSIQASFKTPQGSLINVRGENSDALANNLLALNEHIGLIRSVEAAFVATDTIAAKLGLDEPAAQYEAQEAATQHQQHQPQQNVVQFPPQQAPQYPQYPQQPGALPGPADPVGAPTPAPVPLPGASAPAAANPSQVHQPGALVCDHNMAAKVVPAGISKRTGQPYRAFAVCPLDKQYQCNFRKAL